MAENRPKRRVENVVTLNMGEAFAVEQDDRGRLRIVIYRPEHSEHSHCTASKNCDTV